MACLNWYFIVCSLHHKHNISTNCYLVVLYVSALITEDILRWTVPHFLVFMVLKLKDQGHKCIRFIHLSMHFFNLVCNFYSMQGTCTVLIFGMHIPWVIQLYMISTLSTLWPWPFWIPYYNYINIVSIFHYFLMLSFALSSVSYVFCDFCIVGVLQNKLKTCDLGWPCRGHGDSQTSCSL